MDRIGYYINEYLKSINNTHGQVKKSAIFFTKTVSH